MNFYMVMVLLAVLTFMVAAGYLIVFIRSATRTLERVDSLLETAQQTTTSAQQTVLAADETLKLLNDRLPAILDDINQTTANARSISEGAEFELRKSMADNVTPGTNLSMAANISNYVLKGYSVWKKLRRKRLA